MSTLWLLPHSLHLWEVRSCASLRELHVRFFRMLFLFSAKLQNNPNSFCFYDVVGVRRRQCWNFATDIQQQWLTSWRWALLWSRAFLWCVWKLLWYLLPGRHLHTFPLAVMQFQSSDANQIRRQRQFCVWPKCVWRWNWESSQISFWQDMDGKPNCWAQALALSFQL